MNALLKPLAVVGILVIAVLVTDAKSPQPVPPAIQEIAPGRFQVGTVHLDKQERSIAFPATVNMTNGLVEYFLVTGVGKLHESVLRTEINPLHIHVAALLLDAKGAGTNLTVRDFNSAEIPGEKVNLIVRWQEGGKQRTSPAEQFVFNTKTAQSMSTGPWVYNGSQVHDGTLVAERDGQVISIMSDPLALINNPRPGRENDELWLVNSNAIPSLNMKVECVLQFRK